VATRTAVATPTTAATSIPNQQACGAQFQSAQYTSGPTQLQVGQRTSIQATYVVTNSCGTRLDYTSTVLFTTGPEVTATTASATAGVASISGNQVRWGGFSLDPGESATITMTLDVVPAAASVGRPVVLISNVDTTARAANGGFINVTGAQLTTAAVSGLAAGGIVAGAAAPATTGGVTPGGVTTGVTRPPAPVSAAPAAATPRQLPIVGTGTAGDMTARMALTALLAALAVVSFPLAVRLWRRRAG
jgi:hypothetical protein